MKNKNELVPFDYVREQIGISINRISEKVGIKNSIEISFFTLGETLFDHDESKFRELVSVIEQKCKIMKEVKKKVRTNI